MNNLLNITHPLNALLMILMGIGVGMLITRHFRLGWRLYWIGAAIFVLSQVLHIPFNAVVGLLFRDGVIPAPPTAWKTLFNAVFLGLSAGIFEEVARYLGYRYWAKEACSGPQGLLYGAGHGGIEAILLGLLTLYSVVQMFLLRGQDLTSLVSPNQLDIIQKQIVAYWSLPWVTSLLGALERLLVIPVQLTLSIIVLQAFTRRQIRWLILAIFWHALLDAATVYAASVWGVSSASIQLGAAYWRGAFMTEALIAIFTLFSMLILWFLYQSSPPLPAQPAYAPVKYPPHPFQITPKEETAENLNQTRYI